MKRAWLDSIGKVGKWTYLVSGLILRLQQRALCPCCASSLSTIVDRKFFHTLHLCSNCHLLYRYPKESASEMSAFYERGYHEPGLTTELPSPEEVDRLMATNFVGSEKCFSYHIQILHSLGFRPGDRLLDYGANWGYATLQFLRAGFATRGFEPSKARAEFGKRLGAKIETEVPQGESLFDVVYSCHVLEHVPNPLETLRVQLSLVRPGGLVVAHTPNGSTAMRRRDPVSFRSIWGQPHPVLLTENFIKGNFADYPCYISSDDRPEVVAQWDRNSRHVGPVNQSGLFFALVRKRLLH